MEKKKTNLQMLIWGIKHIAENHGFKCYTKWQEDGNVCIYGDNIPTLSDVRMLAEDCKLTKEDVYEDCGWGIVGVEFSEEWFEKWAKKPYEQPIHEFWRRMV